LRFSGNLATRDLSTVIDKDDVPAALADSEYLDMIYVAVPKNSAKDWENKYERLTQMIVPRSSVCARRLRLIEKLTVRSSKLASDDEYHLYSVTIFKKVKEEFLQKCREQKYAAESHTS
jgi:V-type H+-transporting ATPase subunit C